MEMGHGQVLSLALWALIGLVPHHSNAAPHKLV